MKRIIHILLSIGILFILNVDSFGQGRIYDGPEDGAGDPYLEREGFMTGNRVQLLFKNNTGNIAIRKHVFAQIPDGNFAEKSH